MISLCSVPTTVCRDWWEWFAWDSSPDSDRCPRRAEAHVWHEGTALITDTTDQALRLFAGRVLREA